VLRPCGVVNEANAHLVVEAGLVERIYNLMSEKKEDDEVGRCRLTVSKSMLKAPMLSALEARI